jgi:hypothetical protein
MFPWIGETLADEASTLAATQGSNRGPQPTVAQLQRWQLDVLGQAVRLVCARQGRHGRRLPVILLASRQAGAAASAARR